MNSSEPPQDITKSSQCFDATGKTTSHFISIPAKDQLWVLIGIYKFISRVHCSSLLVSVITFSLSVEGERPTYIYKKEGISGELQAC